MKKEIWRVGGALCLLGLGFVSAFPPLVRQGLSLSSYLIAGLPVLMAALNGLRRRDVFDENFLMAIASLGALLMGEGAEAAGVMVFYQVGELFQGFAVDRSRRQIAQAMNLRPDSANLVGPDGQAISVEPESLKIGDLVLVKPGERVPVDGLVKEGESELDCSSLNGESLPCPAAPGQRILSGSINLLSPLKLLVEKSYENSQAAKIMALAEDASQHKSKQEKFITRFARVYTPLVVGAALALALIPPLFWGDFKGWIYRALNFLVVSCPCALVISIPLSFFGGLGAASSAGILFKGSDHLETLARADAFVFDKTGTLTRGRFKVAQTEALGLTQEELLALAARAERFSPHPLARALREACPEAPFSPEDWVRELTGGVEARLEGQSVFAGNRALMQAQGISVPFPKTTGAEVIVARAGQVLGRVILKDEQKPCTAHALGELKSEGVKKLILLTGDRETAARDFASKLPLDLYRAELLPEDKLRFLKDFRHEREEKAARFPHSFAFVGDGVNDAPALALSDVGIAMGALGSDAAIEAADIVIMDDDPCKLVSALRISRRTLRIARQSAALALTVKALVLLLSALGKSTLWLAVFADAGVLVLAVLNSLRALKAQGRDKVCVLNRGAEAK